MYYSNSIFNTVLLYSTVFKRTLTLSAPPALRAPGANRAAASGAARGGKKAAARATRMDAGDSARAVEIAGTQERGYGETRWTAYQVRVRRGHAIESEVERRYSHFRVLREGLMDDVLSAAGESKAVAKGAAKLGSLFGGSVQSFLEGHFADEGLPALPSAMVFGQQRRSPEVVAERRRELSRFLLACWADQRWRLQPRFRTFLGLDVAVPPPAVAASAPPAEAVDQMVAMGFAPEDAVTALAATDNDVRAATAMMFRTTYSWMFRGGGGGVGAARPEPALPDRPPAAAAAVQVPAPAPAPAPKPGSIVELRRRLSEKEQTANFLASDGLDVATIRAEIQQLQAEIAAIEVAHLPDEPISEEDWASLPSHERCASIQQLRQTTARVGAELGLRDLQVSRLVGHGANAAAYLARVNPDGRLGRNHANVLLVIKVIFNYHSVDTRTDAAWIAKNKQEDVGEVRADIVPVLAIFDDNTDSLPDFRTEFPDAGCRHTTFLLQPFYSGGTLQSLIKRFNDTHGRDGQALPRPVVQSYLQQMLDAVMRLQKLGLAHRDVKSDNILLTGPSLHGCPTDLALGDFGEVGPLRLEYLTDGTVSKGGAIVALCPEVLAGIDAATRSRLRSTWLDYSKNDCWAVGVVACEMATGRTPWAGNPPYDQRERRALPEHCGRTVRDVIDGLTRVDHDERLSAEAAYHEMLQVFSQD